MNRRNFLSMFGAGVAVAAAPVYFDMGKNLWRVPSASLELQTGMELYVPIYGRTQLVYYDAFRDQLWSKNEETGAWALVNT